MKNGAVKRIQFLWKATVIMASFTAVVLPAKGQPGQVLTLTQFIAQVKQYHPVVKQAQIVADNAAAKLLAARGGFDPVFEWNDDSKTFGGTDYYKYSNPGLKVPTTAGVVVKSGVEKTNGTYANPELSQGVASYLGVEVSLLKGLLIDKQRATLQQAKLFRQQSGFEQANIINDLLFEAYTAYWQWAAAQQLHQLYTRYVTVAGKRLELIKTGFRLGDRSVADTVEAFSQMQGYKLLQSDAAVELTSRYYELCLFLWDEQQKSYLLADTYVPDTDAFNGVRILPPLEALELQLNDGNPLLPVYRAKISVAEVDRKLKFQSLLPTVDIRANLLSKEYFDKLQLSNYYLNNNYKFGFTIKTPLLFRQARGEFKVSQLKVKDNLLEFTQKLTELSNKLRTYFAQAQLYQQQRKDALLLRSSYEVLLRTEQLKLTNGESSLLLIALREGKLIEAEQKLNQIQLKYLKALTYVDALTASFQ